MKFWEAMKHLEEGKKVRKCQWRKDEYIYISEGAIVTQGKLKYNFYNPTNSDWELYDDRYDVNQQLKNLYNLLKELALGDCNEYDEYLDWESIDKKDHRDCMFYLYEQLEEMNKYYKLDK